MDGKMNSQLIDIFIESAEKAIAKVTKVKKDPIALNEALMEITSEEDSVLLSESVDLDSQLFSIFKKNKKVITPSTVEQLSSIGAGVTDSFCGIAKTGSVCISISDNQSIYLSMLTNKHIVVVDGETIVARPKNVFSEEYLDGKGLRKSFTFITGPSATADMGPLVRGVHGPGELHIIILE